MVHAYHGTIPNKEKEQAIDIHSTSEESPGNRAEWEKKKKPISKGWEMENRSVAARVRDGERGVQG